MFFISIKSLILVPIIILITIGSVLVISKIFGKANNNIKKDINQKIDDLKK